MHSKPAETVRTSRASRPAAASPTEPTPEIARTLARAAAENGRALVVGNRAGIVEWANPAWTRITGFPLEETISKPIAHFLDAASIEIELVDFVAQHFVDGRACTIEFPFETFDERAIWVHLEVQPVRNALGEITEFVALASDVTERRARELEDDRLNTIRDEPSQAALSSHADTAIRATFDSTLSLSAEIETVCERFSKRVGPLTHFDVALATGLPSIESNRVLLAELASQLLASAFEDIDASWGCVTVMTGRAEAGRRHVSLAHPVPVWPRELGERPFLYVEVHDTAIELSLEVLDGIAKGRATTGEPRSRALVTAGELARVLGGSLHVDSTPGCGTQALALLPIGTNASTA